MTAGISMKHLVFHANDTDNHTAKWDEEAGCWRVYKNGVIVLNVYASNEPCKYDWPCYVWSFLHQIIDYDRSKNKNITGNHCISKEEAMQQVTVTVF